MFRVFRMEKIFNGTVAENKNAEYQLRYDDQFYQGLNILEETSTFLADDIQD